MKDYGKPVNGVKHPCETQRSERLVSAPGSLLPSYGSRVVREAHRDSVVHLQAGEKPCRMNQVDGECRGLCRDHCIAFAPPVAPPLCDLVSAVMVVVKGSSVTIVLLDL